MVDEALRSYYFDPASEPKLSIWLIKHNHSSETEVDS
jgi:hypothetical protein